MKIWTVKFINCWFWWLVLLRRCWKYFLFGQRFTKSAYYHCGRIRKSGASIMPLICDMIWAGRRAVRCRRFQNLHLFRESAQLSWPVTDESSRDDNNADIVLKHTQVVLLMTVSDNSGTTFLQISQIFPRKNLNQGFVAAASMVLYQRILRCCEIH